MIRAGRSARIERAPSRPPMTAREARTGLALASLAHMPLWLLYAMLFDAGYAVGHPMFMTAWAIMQLFTTMLTGALTARAQARVSVEDARKHQETLEALRALKGLDDEPAPPRDTTDILTIDRLRRDLARVRVEHPVIEAIRSTPHVELMKHRETLESVHRGHLATSVTFQGAEARQYCRDAVAALAFCIGLIDIAISKEKK